MKPLHTYFSGTRSVTKTENLVATDYGKEIDQRERERERVAERSEILILKRL